MFPWRQGPQFQGVLKTFFYDKAFGFIAPGAIFCAVRDSPELEKCQVGDTVTYDRDWDARKGKYKAVNVKKLVKFVKPTPKYKLKPNAKKGAIGAKPKK